MIAPFIGRCWHCGHDHGDGGFNSLLKRIIPQEKTSDSTVLRERLDALVAAVANLSTIKDGKTLFEGSPTKDGDCCAAWQQLNDAIATAKLP